MRFSETVQYCIEIKKKEKKTKQTYFRHFIIERKLDGPPCTWYIQNGKTFEIAGHRYELSWSVSPLSTRFLRLFRGVVNAHRRKVNHEASEWKASSEKWRVPGCGMAIWKFLPLASSADFHLANAANAVDNRKQLSWS